jgi:hypothetical protein
LSWTTYPHPRTYPHRWTWHMVLIHGYPTTLPGVERSRRLFVYVGSFSSWLVLGSVVVCYYTVGAFGLPFAHLRHTVPTPAVVGSLADGLDPTPRTLLVPPRFLATLVRSVTFRFTLRFTTRHTIWLRSPVVVGLLLRARSDYPHGSSPVGSLVGWSKRC